MKRAKAEAVAGDEPVLSVSLSGDTVVEWSGRRRAAGGVHADPLSDDNILYRVGDALHNLPDLDASNIDVEVHAGIVVLKGIVGGVEQRHMAEEVAAHAYGVRDVENQLRILSSDPTDVRR